MCYDCTLVNCLLYDHAHLALVHYIWAGQGFTTTGLTGCAAVTNATFCAQSCTWVASTSTCRSRTCNERLIQSDCAANATCSYVGADVTSDLLCYVTGDDGPFMQSAELIFFNK